jgi:hypothetical protein
MMDESERLWQHALHEDTLFNERLNIFLVMQGLLLAVVGVMFQRTGGNTRFIVQVIASAAMVLTILWWRVQARQKYKIDVLVEELKPKFPGFADLQARTKPPRWLPVSNAALLANAFPVALLIVWGVILWVT